MIDGLLVTTTLILYLKSEFLLYLFIGALYLLLRDAIAGRSVGKFLCGLVVIDLKTGRPCGQARPSIGTRFCSYRAQTSWPRFWRQPRSCAIPKVNGWETGLPGLRWSKALVQGMSSLRSRRGGSTSSRISKAIRERAVEHQ